MSELIESIRKIDWKNGIISKDEAERFVNRFAFVILRQAVRSKEKKVENGDSNP
jgi:hypothetical protein